MRHPVFNPAVSVTIIASIIWVACVLWAPVDTLNYVLRIAIAACSIATMTRYGRASWQVYREGARRPEDSLILGIFIASAAFLEYSAFTIFSRATGGLSMNPWSAFYPFLILFSFLLIVTATRFPGENWSGVKTLGVAVLAFFGFAATMAMHILSVPFEIIARIIPH